MKRILDVFLDLLYPPRCCFCRKVIEREAQGICGYCREKLSLPEKGKRRRMLDGGFVCTYPLLYDEMVRESFLRFKFYGAISYAEPYSVILSDCFKDDPLLFDIVTWVPLSRRKKKKRGYDQAELLAKGISALLGLDCRKILYKNKETKTQSLLKNGDERRRNVKGAYSLSDENTVKGKKILIIDDIVTTGSTLSECCRVLKKAGAELVTAAAFASAE